MIDMTKIGSLRAERYSTPPYSVGVSGSGYDAVDQTGKRRTVSPLLKSEDDHLRPQARKALTAASRDLNRNFALVAWAVRQHLNYLTEFDFQMRTGDAAIDTQVEYLMEVWSRPANCDAGGRHPLPRMLRLAEQRKIVDGDVGLLKLASGQLQPIEADRIKDPEDKGDSTWVHGIKINGAGRPLAYAIHRRSTVNNSTFERTVPASSLIHHAQFDRFDQVRGVSPIAAAINSFKDVYEGIDLAMAKLKVEQLFALVFFRDNTDPIGETTGDDSTGYDVEMGKGPIKLDLDPGDKAEFLKSDNPGGATQEFLKLVIRIALSSLDLPYGFFDSGDTNFFGGKAGWMVYERSLLAKIRDVVNLLRQVTIWKLQQWIIDGDLILPPGMTVGDVAFEWVHRGMPWWDQSKEIDGDLAAIGAGLSDPYTICKKRGMGEWEENVDRIAKARAYAAAAGVPITFDRAGNKPMPEAETEQQPAGKVVQDG
jgi:capsid protein